MHTLFRTALLLSLFAPSIGFSQSNFQFFQPVNPPRAAQVMVHRGLAGTAPENSAAAIQKCVEDYCEWAEVDVRLTKDGHHVVIHNDTVDATTNGSGRVAEMTLDDLQKLDAGSWFAPRFAGNRLLSLKEALALSKGKINLYLDCKRINPTVLVEDIVDAGMQNQVIVFAGLEILAKVKAASKGTVPGMIRYRPKMEIDVVIKQISPAAVEIGAEDVTAELCQRFHAAGIKVQAEVLGADRDSPAVWAKVIDAGVDWLQTDDPAGIRFFEAKRNIKKFPVMIACHRGASRYAPENTLPAIAEAARLGVDFAEIDIRTTLDGNTVLMHDGTINRTTNGTGTVRSHRLEELKSLSSGAWFGSRFRDTRIPTFDEGLQQYGKTMGAYLDAKDIAPETLVSMIQKYGHSERHVVYQSLDYCRKLRALDPSVRIMPPLKRVEDLATIATVQPYAVDASWSVLSAEMIADCHRYGIKVFSDALGPNESVEQYEKAINWGIDCIQTDHPLRVLRAIERMTAQSQ